MSDDYIQGNLFDGTGPERGRKGMDSAREHAGDDWFDVTFRNAVEYLRTHVSYCGDDLWRYNLMPYPPPPPYGAIGALTRQLIAHGYLEHVGMMKSRRTPRHGSNLPVYRSKLYKAQRERTG